MSPQPIFLTMLLLAMQLSAFIHHDKAEPHPHHHEEHHQIQSHKRRKAKLQG